jgi:CheY-like chemotaxis protein
MQTVILFMWRQGVIQSIAHELNGNSQIRVVTQNDYSKAEETIRCNNAGIALVEVAEAGAYDIDYCISLCARIKELNCRALLMCPDRDETSIVATVNARHKNIIDDFVFSDASVAFITAKLTSTMGIPDLQTPYVSDTHERKTIFFVDDDPTSLSVGKEMLDPQYEVLTLNSGLRLRSVLEKRVPDLILLDIDMPQMDGFDIIRELKGSTSTQHIPVIFLTAMIDPESEAKGLGLGAIDYITKPFSRELLLTRISLHLLVEEWKRSSIT